MGSPAGGSGGSGSGSGSKKSSVAKSGWLLRAAGDGSGGGSGGWSRVWGLVRHHDLLLYANESRDDDPLAAVSLLEAGVGVPDVGRVSKRFAMELTLANGTSVVVCAENKDEQEGWLGALATAAVGDGWPGGVDFTRRPSPLLYGLWLAGRGVSGGSGAVRARTLGAAVTAVPTAVAAAAAAAAAAARGGAAAGMGRVLASGESPLPRLAALKAVPAWQRKALTLQKIRLCSVLYDGT